MIIYPYWDLCLSMLVNEPSVVCFTNMFYEVAFMSNPSQIARFVWPTWGPPWACRPQVGPMLAPWTLLSGLVLVILELSTLGNRSDGVAVFPSDDKNIEEWALYSLALILMFSPVLIFVTPVYSYDWILDSTVTCCSQELPRELRGSGQYIQYIL